MSSVLFEKLNPAQCEAVSRINGPLLIVAGAGSGKTRVLTCRIAYLLEQGVQPSQILAITFTNKAAGEMRERVSTLVGPVAKNLWLSTFHAFCARFLRMEIEGTGAYSRHFTIYDEGDTRSIIKACLKELSMDEKQYPVSGISAAISGAKNLLKGPEVFAQEADAYYQQKVAQIYQRYQSKLETNNALDFDDLLRITVLVLRQRPEVADRWQRRFSYLMVDEYQDTNHSQYQLARLLAAKHRNICVVGDADQSIYGWRGADIRNILDFEKDYPEAVVIKLEQNYRSTQIILDAANAVIDRNTGRKPKQMWTDNQGGEPVTLHVADNEHGEARYIAEQMIRMNTVYRMKYDGMAVLYRTNAQSRVIEEALLTYGIPYTIVGGVKFYDRKEIKDMLAYLRVIFNPSDAVSLRRIINAPRRGIGDVTLTRLEEAAGAEKSLFEVIGDPRALSAANVRGQGPLLDLHRLFAKWQDDAVALTVADLIAKVMKESGYVEELEREKTSEAEGRIENLQEMLTVAQEFVTEEEEATLENFLSHMALVSDADTAELSGERVKLMTLHSSKGLEFPVVFMAGMEESLFPHARTLFQPEELEEERRLCYVGITRAEKKIFLVRARSRTIYGRTTMNRASQFLEEIPEKLLDKPKPAGQGMPMHPASTVPRRSPEILRPLPKPTVQREATEWKLNDRVSHEIWGIGTVIEIRGTGQDQEIKVAFPNNGIKSLASRFAPLKRA